MKNKNRNSETSKQNEFIILCGLVIFATASLLLPQPQQSSSIKNISLALEESLQQQKQQGTKNGYSTMFTSTNNSTEGNSSEYYIGIAKQLLNQVSLEYRKGNFTGAEEFAIRAYLDNFEYVEPDLVKHGAKDLKEQIEHMMRIELRDMIKSRVSQDQLDSQISSTAIKLTEAMRKLME